jgi:hypothetical protein
MGTSGELWFSDKQHLVRVPIAEAHIAPYQYGEVERSGEVLG